jgi:hypothetical protein
VTHTRFFGEMLVGVAALAAAIGLAFPVVPARSVAPSVSTHPVALAPPRQAADSIASYSLVVRLDAEQHTVTGRGIIRWRNAARIPATELYLHLYLNAFENEKTLFFRSPFRTARSGVRPERWGGIDVKHLVAEQFGHRDLWPAATPDDPADRTDVRVPLPEPVQPGAELSLRLEFESRLPTLVERTGFVGNFHFVGQWFPKLARREPDGRWRHFPFHPQAEFYSDFGGYDVTLDVPEGMRVGATGVRTEERVLGGRRIVRHQADNVHDFAWTAWEGFRERSEVVNGTRVIVLYPEDQEHNAEVSLSAVRQALPRLANRYGHYPYPVLTIVDPPRAAAYAGGMEYPMLITTGQPWWAGYLTRQVELVTVHELAHQWFYGMVATDESAWPFLDEGLTSYAESVTMRELFGPGSLLDWAGFTLSSQELRRVVGQSAISDVIAQPADRFPSLVALGELAYDRTSAALFMLANVYGAERLERALGRYAREQRFRHPGPDALLAVIEQDLGQNAASSLRAVLFERARVDYRVRWLTNRAQPVSQGATSLTANGIARESERHLGRVLVSREGALKLPVEVLLIDAWGRSKRHTWDGNANSAWLDHAGSQPLAGAVVDPERSISLDQDFTNNAITGEPAWPLRTFERLTYWAGLGRGALP